MEIDLAKANVNGGAVILGAEQYITALSWTGIVAVISFGLYLHAKYPLLSRLWLFGAVCVAVVLVYLFPETLAPGCGGMPKAFRLFS